jgi:hypothetical protein
MKASRKRWLQTLALVTSTAIALASSVSVVGRTARTVDVITIFGTGAAVGVSLVAFVRGLFQRSGRGPEQRRK